MLKSRSFIPSAIIFSVFLLLIGFGRTVTANTASFPDVGLADSSMQDLSDTLLSRFAGSHEKPPIVLVHGWQGANIGLACQRHSVAFHDDNWGLMDEWLGDGITLNDEEYGTAPFTGLGFYVEIASLKSGGSTGAADANDPDWDCTPRAQDNVANLIEAIDAAKAATGQDKVILIAHSMGGLVSRAYLEDSALYRDDVVAFFTLGTPHIGVPIGAIQTLIEVLTLGFFDAAEYCGAQPVVCQFSDDETKNPAGFTGIETFNVTFNTRAPGVYYHLIGGDAILTHRGTIGTTMAGLVTGPDDGIVPQASALGISSGDGRLAPLMGDIDRLALTPTLHIDLFAEDPTFLVNPYERHFSFHDQNLIQANGGSTSVSRYIPSPSFLSCLSPSLLSRNNAFACGSVQSLSARSTTMRQPSRALPSQFGTLGLSRSNAHTFEIESGELVLSVHSNLDMNASGDAALAVSLIGPDGEVLSAENLIAAGATIKKDANGQVFWLPEAEAGTWQVNVAGQNAPPDTRYMVKAIEVSPDEYVKEATYQRDVSANNPSLGVREAPSTVARVATVPRTHDSPHSCAVSQIDDFQVGDTVDVTFTLTTSNTDQYPEFLDLYAIDGPDGWDVIGQSAAPVDDSAWNRATGATGCNSSGVAYWGLSVPVLAGLNSTCDIAVDNLPTSGSYHGPWGQTETVLVWQESFEGAFPPAGWQNVIENGSGGNAGFTQSADFASDGNFSAKHDNYDVGFFSSHPKSWFVSPVLTLEAGDVLVWDQYAEREESDDRRELFISTGSNTPSDGEFIEIGSLVGDYDEWETWQYVFDDAEADDNNETAHDYSGREDVYFAFYYEGDDADRWYIDNVRIEREVVKSTEYEFKATYEVDSTHMCPGSDFVGVTSATDAESGLTGIAMGDLVDFSTNMASCNIAAACPEPSIVLSTTLSTNGACPGVAMLNDVDPGPVSLTLCYEMATPNNDVTVISHTVSSSLHGDLTFTGSSNNRGTVSRSETVNVVLPDGVTCYDHTSMWTAETAEGVGQAQGTAATGAFATTTYSSSDSNAYQICTNAGIPTAAELEYFTAEMTNSAEVRLEWETSFEVNHAGFNIYRREADSRSNWVLVTPQLIASRGSQAQGASYSYIDSSVEAGFWEYVLEDVDTDNVAFRHITFIADVQVQAPTATTLLSGETSARSVIPIVLLAVGTLVLLTRSTRRIRD